MSNPIMLGYEGRHAKIEMKVLPGHAPLDLTAYEADLDTATEWSRRQLRCAKLAHDAHLLRAVLLVQAEGGGYTLAGALEDMALAGSVRKQADRLLAGTLRMAGWRQDTPDPNPQREYQGTRGIMGNRIPIHRGKERSADVLVNLNNGMTIVAEADGAYEYHWEYPWREPATPGKSWRDYERVDPEAIALLGDWWNTGKYTDGLDLGGGYWSASADISKRVAARDAVTTPDLPVDLEGSLADLGGRR